MLSVSDAISPSTVRRYYRLDFSAANQRYFSQDNELQGTWHGRLASELGLTGAVTDAAFDRLSDGQHPGTGEQLIKHRDSVKTKKGGEVAHRAAWDAVSHCPKSVSLAAIVGGDERIITAHQAANRVMLDAMQQLVQARMGGNKQSETTGKWIVATFVHDTARPMEVEDEAGNKIPYPAPHLHSHNVIFNMTEDVLGQARSLQSKEIFRAQSMGRSVYHAEMAVRLQALGYEIARGTNHSCEIVGFTPEYLAAESMRSASIKDRMEESGLTGRRAEEIIAHQDRNEKLHLAKDEMRILHQSRAMEYGDQPRQVVEQAMERGQAQEASRYISAHDAVSWAILKNGQNEAVFDHWAIVRDALDRGQGHVRWEDVERDIAERRVIKEQSIGEAKDLLSVDHVREWAPMPRYTTPSMLAMERRSIELVIGSGIGKGSQIANTLTKEEIRAVKTPQGFNLNDAQMHAVWNVVTSPDRFVAVNGAAGVGKCLAPGTPVLLHCGCARNVEDIKEGDLLMGPDSKPRRVLSLASGCDQMYRVTPKRGEPYEVNSAHILSLKMSAQPQWKRGVLKGWKWRGGEIRNLSISDYFAQTKMFRKQAKGWRTGVDFPRKGVLLDPYFLGVWLGDGNSGDQTISNPDPEILSYLQEYMRTFGLKAFYCNQTRRNACPAIHLSPKLGSAVNPANPVLDALRAYGLIGNKHMPIAYKTNDRENRLRLLAGLLDTDGHLSNGCFDFISKCRRLAEDVAFVARSLGFAAYLTECEKSCPTSSGKFTGTYFRLCISGNTSEIPTLISRKKAPDRRQIKDVLRTGIKVEPCGYGPYFGFELDGDGLFLLGDFTVTHNTTALWLVKNIAEENGYEIRGLAPTSGATAELKKAGIKSSTIQGHLLRKRDIQEKPRLYFLDESSLMSTKQASQFLESLRPEDRVLFVGDTRQHQSVEAGRIFEELQQIGMKTYSLNKIVRQQNNPELLKVIQDLSKGNVADGIQALDKQGRIHEVKRRDERFNAIAQAYLEDPTGTLVVSPDNRSRQEINAVIRDAMRKGGQLKPDAYKLEALIGRQDLTEADMAVAQTFKTGDIVQFTRSKKELGIAKGEYGAVVRRDLHNNLVTVDLDGKRTVTFDPSKTGSHLYVREDRQLAAGERIQFTAVWRQKGIANRDMGTITEINAKEGTAKVLMDDGREIKWHMQSMRHADYAFSATSYSSQAKTVNRVLIHIDTGDSRIQNLLDKIMLYVAASRGSDDVQLFVNERESLEQSLSKIVLKTKGLSPKQLGEYKSQLLAHTA